MMADQHRRGGGQCQKLVNRAVKRVRVAAGKVGPGRAHIGHEKRIAHKNRVACQVSHVGWGVSRHQQGSAPEGMDVLSNRNLFAKMGF